MDVRQVIPRDAIPSVDDPTFTETYDGDPEDRVIVYEPSPAGGPTGEHADERSDRPAEGSTEGSAGDDEDGHGADPTRPRAYPLRYLNYHEIVNDRVDRPLAVTWCPLCGSAVVYDRRVGGRTLTFGVSGKLADDDLVMYDRETDSEWKQSLGECIAGPLKDAELEVLPAAVVTARRFHEDYDGVVLEAPGGDSEAASDDDEPAPIDYDEQPYREYETTPGFGLGAHRGTGGREWSRDDLDPKTVVLGIERDGDAVGVPLPVVQEASGALTVTVGGDEVVVFATEDGIHAFEPPETVEEFDPVRAGADDGVRFRADGTTWNGATGEAADGRRLERVPARRLFAFTWQDDHGPDAFVLAVE